MGIQITRDNNSVVARLADELSIYTANDYRDALLEELPALQDLTVNLAAVTELDSAGLQLLMALRQLPSNVAVHFVEHSTAVCEVLDLLGLARQFDAPEFFAAGATS